MKIMTNQMRSFVTSSTVFAALLGVLIFFMIICFSMIPHMLFTTFSGDDSMSAQCCDMNKQTGMVQGHLPASHLSEQLPVISVLSFAGIMILFLQNVFTHRENTKGKQYSRFVRDKYGGYNLFNIFLYLFRTGILNPKIYIQSE